MKCLRATITGSCEVTVQAYRVETVVTEDGELRLSHLPFRAGEHVEVIVLKQQESTSGAQRYPLRGLPYRYDDPFEPVGEDEWDALR